MIELGMEPTSAPVTSQVMLSIALPAQMAMLIWLTSSERVMGHHRNRKLTMIIASLGAAVGVLLNLVLSSQGFKE